MSTYVEFKAKGDCLEVKVAGRGSSLNRLEQQDLFEFLKQRLGTGIPSSKSIIFDGHNCPSDP